MAGIKCTVVTFWDPLSLSEKLQPAHLSFVDAQSASQLIVTVGTHLHHILY